MPTKRIDPKIRRLVETSFAHNHRSLFIIIGDHGRDQLANLYQLMSRVTERKIRILWCYKKALEFSSSRSKRTRQIKQAKMKGSYDSQVDEAFDLMISGGAYDIRYSYYKDTQKILGQTFQFLVLQDFEAITPNILCRTIETVEGGGMVVMLLQTMENLEQLYSLTMDSHHTYGGAQHSRFNERFLLTSLKCKSVLIVDDELNLLPINHRTLKYLDKVDLTSVSPAPKGFVTREPIGPPLSLLLDLVKTQCQGEALSSLLNVLMHRHAKYASLTAGRGRGKSAVLGLLISASLYLEISDVVVTAPEITNCATVFEFVTKGLKAFGLEEARDYTVFYTGGNKTEDQIQRQKTGHSKALLRCVERIEVKRQTNKHNLTPILVSYSPVLEVNAPDFVVIDEAAAVPLPQVQRIVKSSKLVFFASTVTGYEGTGRSLTLKLIKDLRKTGEIEEVSMTEPIRYAPGDRIEQWMFDMLCLDVTEDTSPIFEKGKPIPPPQNCEMYEVNRDTLFCGHKSADRVLSEIMSLFVSSHYRNTPDDLQTLSDSPTHRIFVLLDPTKKFIICAVQVSLEGRLEEKAQDFSRDIRLPKGNLIPWTLSSNYPDDQFGQLNGLRIMRIATHTSLQGKGYGKEAVSQILAWIKAEGGDSSLHSKPEADKDYSRMRKTDLRSLETVSTREVVAPLFSPLAETTLPTGQLDYCGVAFGATLQLYRFWQRLGFQCVYVSQKQNETTNESTAILLNKTSDNWQIDTLVAEFRGRFLRLCGSPAFKSLPLLLGLQILDPLNTGTIRPPVDSEDQVLAHLSRYDLRRLELYSQSVLDFHTILDLVPTLAYFVILRGIPGLKLSHVQYVAIVGLGGFGRSLEEVGAEANIVPSQLLAIFCKGVSRISTELNKIMMAAVKDQTVSAGKRKNQHEGLVPGGKLAKHSVSQDARLKGEAISQKLEQERKMLLGST